jgi:shikimate kinase
MRSRGGASSDACPAASKRLSGVRAVFLVGFMGAGKTSVGRALADRLGWPFEDLDDRIEKLEGRLVTQIFQDAGESGFRESEARALRELLASLGPGPRVVALGGGAFVQDANTVLMDEAGVHSVFLDAPAEELFRRCQQEQKVRPLAHDASRFTELYESRRAAYLKADVAVQTSGKDVSAVAWEVACSLGLGSAIEH